MAYLVSITARAERDLARLYLRINAEDSGAALSWYRGMQEAILSLDRQPNRCPQAPENSRLRHLLYGNKPHVYRVIYRVREKERRVEVLHVRHGAREKLKSPGLK